MGAWGTKYNECDAGGDLIHRVFVRLFTDLYATIVCEKSSPEEVRASVGIILDLREKGFTAPTQENLLMKTCEEAMQHLLLSCDYEEPDFRNEIRKEYARCVEITAMSETTKRL